MHELSQLWVVNKPRLIKPCLGLIGGSGQLALLHSASVFESPPVGQSACVKHWAD